ncbi:MAG: 4-(cytidine 5'-diphospho)-2-C-methyl-D-erythritol kinase [Defluviitaleaceae bacterium]|nr:4-(cytidine 5'-diphospho)-2-C-methyl-D-erythritol kinase [Defluviitaleaceae bacterium]
MLYNVKREIPNNLTLLANAKINLALQVVGKRQDGYHDLKMVMQTLLLNDTIFMKKIDEPVVTLKTNLSWLPVDNSNLVVKAAQAIRKEFNIKQGVEIHLTKEIPVSAGLGGGSADCAATLIGMRKLFGLYLPNHELRKISINLGSDVPFLLVQGTALVEGKGEIITPLKPHPFIHVLLAKPSFSVSTASVFREYRGPSRVRNIRHLIKYIEKRDLEGISRNFSNDLEYIISSKSYQIREIKNIMRKNGCIGTQMTGSGPTVFGYFRSRVSANYAMQELYQKGVREVILTGTFNRRKHGNK